MNKKLGLAGVAVTLSLTAVIFLPHAHDIGSAANVAEALMLSNEKIAELSNLLASVENLTALDSVSSTSQNGQFQVTVLESGEVVVTGPLGEGETGKLRISRRPRLIQGELTWGCSGTPIDLMPENCR